MSDDGDPGRSDFARALGAALEESGCSLSALHRELVRVGHPVSIATLSSWRSGMRRPGGDASRRAVEAVEGVLGLAAGALLRRLAEGPELSALEPGRVPFSEAEADAVIAETLRLIDGPPFEVTRELSTQVTTEVGASGRIVRFTTRTLLQAVAPLVTEISYTAVSLEGRTHEPRITPRGARIVREGAHPSGRAHGIVYELDQPLPHGSTAVLEIEFDLSADPTHERESGAFVIHPIRDLVVWTRFHPEAVPDWVVEVEESPGTEGMIERPLIPDVSMHQVRRDFGPGALGVRWGYGSQKQ